MQVQNYLFFDGRCEEALDFYRSALGAEVTALMRFKDAPQDGPQPEEGCAAGPAPDPDKVMHAAFKVGDTMVMASDGHTGEGKLNFQGFGLTLQATSEGDAERFFNALADGGQVIMPLTKTFYSPRFGMTTDRFGVMWMIMVAA